jgi:hypothetical protein
MTMSEFCPLIRIEQSDGISAAAQTVMWLAESGRAGRFVHNIENSASQWETLCALEDALIDTNQNDGWMFVVGQVEDDPEVHGWLTHAGWVVIPLGPEKRKSGTDMLVLRGEEFYTEGVWVWAMTEAAPESGIVLNRELKAGFYIDESLGTQGW